MHFAGSWFPGSAGGASLPTVFEVAGVEGNVVAEVIGKDGGAEVIGKDVVEVIGKDGVEVIGKDGGTEVTGKDGAEVRDKDGTEVGFVDLAEVVDKRGLAVVVRQL